MNSRPLVLCTHSIPETGFNEFETSRFIANELKRFGYEVVEGVLGTGLVATINSDASGPVLALRADMDALEYEIDGETRNVHTCGHDANSSIVLAVAKVLHLDKEEHARQKQIA